MKLYKNETLTERIFLLESNGEKSFKLDFEVVKVGDCKILEFWIYNDRDSELIELNAILKPIIETKNGKERDYTKCLQEITISKLPSKLTANESCRFEIKYEPKIDYFRGLRFDLELNCRELFI